MNERGFTLIELMIAMTLSLVVFGLIGTSLVAYQKNSGRTTRQNDSQDQARTAVDRMVRELRNVASSRATPTLIESAGSYDLVFQTIGRAPPAGSANSTNTQRVRYCLPPDPAPGNPAKEVLMVQTETWTTAATPANPWAPSAGVSPACPHTPGSLPAGASVSTARLAENVTNRYAGENRAAFSYDSATLAQITTVGIDLFVDADVEQSPEEIQLRSAAFLRNQNQPPVASFTASATGAGHVLLNAGASSDPDNQAITFKWYRVVGATRTQIGTTGLLDWAPGAGTYSVELDVTDSGGLLSTQTKSVVVS